MAAYERDNENVFSFIQFTIVQTAAEAWIYDHVPGRDDGHGAMKALRDHYEGEWERDVQGTKAQQTLDILTYTSERVMKFENIVMELNRAYNSLKWQGQEFTDKSKFEQLVKLIKNPQKDIQITVTIETMQEKDKSDYTGAMQYLTTQMAQINMSSIGAPGQNA